MRQLRNTLLCLPFSTLLLFAACGGDDDDATPNPSGGAPSHAGAGGSDARGGEAQGGGDGHGEGAAVCEVLGSLCHAADAGPGPIADCHDVGHEGNATACEAQFASCITTCVADEDGAGGASPDVVSNPYCQAMGELCHFLNDEGTPTGECHEIGHTGKESACIEAFEGCVPLCLAKRELEPDGHEAAGGAGGVSGVGHSEGGAGGVGVGGVGGQAQ